MCFAINKYVAYLAAMPDSARAMVHDNTSR